MSARNFSLEFFPPRTPEGVVKLRSARSQLAALKPAFCSVTFGAGGSTREGTLETVLEIRKEGMAAAPHLSCIGSTRESVAAKKCHGLGRSSRNSSGSLARRSTIRIVRTC